MAGARRSLWLVNGLIVLVVLLAAGGTVYALTSSGGTADQGLRTTPVARGTVAATVSASGAVTSARGSTLNFATSGRVVLGRRVQTRHAGQRDGTAVSRRAVDRLHDANVL